MYFYSWEAISYLEFLCFFYSWKLASLTSTHEMGVMFQYRVPVGPQAQILGIPAYELNNPNPLMNLPQTRGYEVI